MIDNINLYGGLVKVSQELAEIQAKEPGNRTPEEKEKLAIFDRLGTDENLLEAERAELLIQLVIEDEKLKGVAEGVIIDTGEISNYRNIVKNKIRETINEIKSGNIKIKPYNDKICRYCQFADMCKKDFSIDDSDDKE